ncbi:hypothetical protein [Nocardioides soli]|uniref:Phage gpG-like protein n=1 Tax=Nocardioides soli TaxID=1036020 RepID=A0A7W4VSK3_9ACTN|nr:hypothetical protein [Nocardioides soli]MBB3041020.1 phage gpG-like protein [Nocardioides soli]
MLDIDVEGRRALGLLDDIGDRLGRPDEMLDLLVDRVHEYERDLFASGGNGQWPALSAKTVALKGSSRVLVDSGDLLADLTTARDLMGDEAVVASDRAYARFHKSGTGRMPRRDPSPQPPEQLVAQWSEDLLGYVVDGQR